MFRQFYAVETLIAGTDIFSLSRCLGHADIQKTQRFLKTLEGVSLN